MNKHLSEHMALENEPQEPWSIKSDRDADWACRVIMHCQSKIAESKKLAEIECQQIDEWLKETTHDAEASIVAMGELLRPYLLNRLEYEKFKTLKLPAGSISLTKSGPEYTILGEKCSADSPKLLEYVKRSAVAFLKIKESVEWGNFKKTLIPTESGRVITKDGEIIGFMAVFVPPDSISVKAGK